MLWLDEWGADGFVAVVSQARREAEEKAEMALEMTA
jgi:hypothetical protein